MAPGDRDRSQTCQSAETDLGSLDRTLCLGLEIWIWKGLEGNFINGNLFTFITFIKSNRLLRGHSVSRAPEDNLTIW